MLNNTLLYGKRPSDNNTLPYGKRSLENNILPYGKRSFDNNTLPYGERSLDNNTLLYGKRSLDNNTLPYETGSSLGKSLAPPCVDLSSSRNSLRELIPIRFLDVDQDSRSSYFE
ncbi:hypothetical protein NPIL_108041 [Nephila pilipes]|uniref:Uncharacterized protein n=1 Tax=Nephila pilipes TaxID=299642 RepID=A0A8X6TEM7_NEPPI|nr:hypothetical protein NPIL_108041 [Nephila pilipes]